MKGISILGSTGSIGRQTLDVVAAHRDRLAVAALAAGAVNLDLLAEQVRLFAPSLVSVPDAEAALALKERLGSHGPGPEIMHGPDGLSAAATHADAQCVVTALVGALGVKPTARAIESGKTIALANKETLVAAGSVIIPLARKHGARIIPVDSEHSAIFQSLAGWGRQQIRSIWLTGSGGPFRTWSKEQMGNATISDALRHPNWSMGAKITVDSATMMNKGLEIIEARWLFDVEPDMVRVVIHPQSILHSAVEYIDGSVVGQMGVPDMRLPIHFALFYPERVASERVPALDLLKVASLTFEEPDYERFPCLRLARQAAGRDDTTPSVLNAANEVAVEAFLKGRIRFNEIAACIERVLDLHESVSRPSLADILDADLWARETCLSMLAKLVSETR